MKTLTLMKKKVVIKACEMLKLFKLVLVLPAVNAVSDTA